MDLGQASNLKRERQERMIQQLAHDNDVLKRKVAGFQLALQVRYIELCDEYGSVLSAHGPVRSINKLLKYFEVFFLPRRGRARARGREGLWSHDVPSNVHMESCFSTKAMRRLTMTCVLQYCVGRGLCCDVLRR